MKPEVWADAVKHLARRDPVLRKLVRTLPPAALPARGDAFRTLARAVVGQQISVAAAQTIWGRFATLAGRITPARVAALDDEALRGCGFSRAKVAYVKDLARRFASGEVQPRRWTRMDDEAVIAELVAVKGIGRWTAEMFLIFHMKRPDVLPIDDVGLRRAFERHYGRGESFTREAMRSKGEPWAPYRSVATWYLWRSLEVAKD